MVNILLLGPALRFHLDGSSLTAFLDRQIYGGIGLGIGAAAIISMIALSNVGCFFCEFWQFGTPKLISFTRTFSDHTSGYAL